MDDDQQFCLRWNNHQSTLVSVFDTLLEKGMHVDCTLAAEGQTLKAHKVVLSACSPYFESVLSQQYDKHPIIILKDVKYAELRAMMDYMYRGEVNISQDQLAALLKAAESLQIKGLSDNKPSRPPSRPQPAAHPPRAPSPPPQPRDGSVDSREGSVSPTRRRKKARRMSSDAVPAVLPLPPTIENAQGNGEESQCKEEVQRDGVEDLTLDEEAETPAVTHNDVVRNFQWHMERSQDEIMNSSDSVRESQGRKPTTARESIMTRSKKLSEEPPATTTTLAILKNVISPIKPVAPPLIVPIPLEELMENKKEPIQQTKANLISQKINITLPKPIQSPLKTNVTPLKTNMTPLKTNPPPLKTNLNTRKTNVTKKSDPLPETVTPKTESPYDMISSDETQSFGTPKGCTPFKPEKKYRCTNCDRGYTARKNLVRHVTLECGREPQYKCPYCSYSKHRRNELKKHMEKKHPNHIDVK